MKYILICLTLILQSCGSFGMKDEVKRDEELLLQQIPLEKLSTRELNNSPELYLADQSIIQQIDEKSGIVEDSFYTGTDSSRVSFSVNYSQDYEDPTKVQMFDIQYLSLIDSSYMKFWWGLQAKQVTAKYNAIAEESKTNTTAGDRKENLQNFTIFGLGLGHRFRAFAGEMLGDRFFENANFFINYMIHTDATATDKYTGYGYTAEYGLNYRSSKRMFYGGKMSYNWAMVERSAVDDEKLPERSLVFGWLTLGFELGYYF